MMFIKKSPNSHGFVNPRDIEQIWRDEFDWVYREMDYAIFPITIHPDVSGRPQVLLMLERVVGHINSHSGVRWMTMEEIAEDSSLQGQIAAALPSGWTMARAGVAVLSIGRLVVPFAEHAASCRQILRPMTLPQSFIQRQLESGVRRYPLGRW